MIAQYYKYKSRLFEETMKNTSLSGYDRNKLINEYSAFTSKRTDGKYFLNRAMCFEMLELARQGQIPFVIDSSDTKVVLDDDVVSSSNYKGPFFEKLTDLVAVHKTSIYPSNDTIVTPENSGYTNNLEFIDPSTGLAHRVSYVVGNDTIHFTLNCAVKNHENGNDWDSYQYAVMIGLDKLDKNKILDVKSEDTYVDGNADLGNDYGLFCPLGEKKEVSRDNPHATIVEYSDISLNEAISIMIVYSNKKLEPYGTYGWGRSFEYSTPITDNIWLDDLLEKEGYPNLQGDFGALLHSESKYMARRMWKREYEALISLIEYNKVNNIGMPDSVIPLVLLFGGAYSLPGMVPVSVEEYKNVVIPIFERHGYDIPDDFFDGIDPNTSGKKIIWHNQINNITGSISPQIQCPNWENTLRDRGIELVKNKTIGSDTVKKY